LLQVKEQEKEIRILILGLDNAGKTTIVKKLCGQPIDEIEPTLGFQIQTLEYNDYKLNLWDIGGQSSIRAYWRNYFEKTDGLVWVVDSSDLSRMELVRQELEGLLQQERLAGATLLVWANKQDIQGSATSEQIKNFLKLQENLQYKNRHWSIHPCSAVTGDGLMEGMDWLVDDISSRIFLLS
jgi:ADP-ribosylation factor-like protein 2